MRRPESDSERPEGAHRRSGDGRAVSVIRTEQQLRALEQPWRRLFDASQDQSVFASWEWMSSWWEHYGRARKPHVVVVTEGNGDTVGIAPFARRTRLVGMVPVRVLGLFADAGAFGSHLDVLARPDDREEVAGRVIDHVWRAADWDALDLRGLGVESRLRACLDQLPGRHWEVAERTAPFVPLPGAWEEYRKSLKKKVRRNLTYFTNLLEKEHADVISFVEARDETEIRAALDHMSSLHVERRKDSTLGDPVFVGFHREFAPRALAAGWLRLYTMKVGETPIAHMYCLRRNEVLSAYLSAFDQGWARYSAGRQIAAHAIRRAIEEGAREFDWMQGDDRYKYEWTSESRADRRRIVARTLRGASWLATVRAWHEVLEGARSRLTPETRRRLKERIAVARQPLRHRRGGAAPGEATEETDRGD